MPTLLTEKNHIPKKPCLDFSFFTFCKRRNIPIGLFYRDIWWRFNNYYTSLNNYIAKLFYLYDLLQYNRLLDVLFVPSEEMVRFLPIKMRPKLYSLPSGLTSQVITNDFRNLVKRKENLKNKIFNILYVGGIGQMYNLSMMMEVVSNIGNFHFTVCCRKSDWDKNKAYFIKYINSNIQIVHKSGEEIDDLYANADLFCLFVKPTINWTFAVPYKLFEAIGHYCPIIAAKGTWVANFIEKNKIGITCNYDTNSLLTTLKSLTKSQLLDAGQKCAEIAVDNTWEHRCHEVASMLLSDK